MATFDYNEAFKRNIGWVTEAEQQQLRSTRVAIAGMGGVGGSHLVTLTRLGVGAFNISDFDVFELPNFNRQVGATMRHLGRPKIDCLAAMALDINPDLCLNRFSTGVNEASIEAFLEGANIYVDGIDFFAMTARSLVFEACAAKGIPAITAAPIGWGTSLLVFMPGEMTFEDYFQLRGHAQPEQLRRFLAGLSPEGLQLGPLVDPSRLDLEQRIAPSTPVGCELCAALAATTIMKILLGRGPVDSAPTSLHLDAYSGTLRRSFRPGGTSDPAIQAALRR